MRTTVALATSLLAAGCASSPPPAPVAPPPAATPPTVAAPPAEARFVDVTATSQTVPVPACHQVLVSAVDGSVVASGQSLSAGDVLATTQGPVELHGSGVAVVATAAVSPCNVPRALVLSTAASDLALFGGTLHARLDLDDRSVAPTVYLGRLAGTASVPEHAHDKSWEILCAVQAAGTFTLAGEPRHLGSRTCVFVPPGTRHSWQPDPGGPALVAVQLYAPPGPEQRFKKLAAEPPK